MEGSESLIQGSSAETPIKDTPSIKSAQNFFESTFGLSVGVDGLLKGDVSPTQLKSLSDWHEITSDEGIDMPTENIFYKKVLLAVSLWPQKDKEGINYLLGKGIGVEIALRGNVRGRSRANVFFHIDHIAILNYTELVKIMKKFIQKNLNKFLELRSCILKQIDRAKLHSYLDLYVIKPNVEKIKNRNTPKSRAELWLRKMAHRFKIESEEEGRVPTDHEELDFLIKSSRNDILKNDDIAQNVDSISREELLAILEMSYERQDCDEVVELEAKHKILDEVLDRAEAHRQTYQKKIW